MANELNAESVLRYLRNTVSASPTIVYTPNLADDATVINIETIPSTPGRMVMDLDNGYTICFDVDVYKR